MVFLIRILKDIFDIMALVIIILIAIVSLLIDGPKLKRKGYTKELIIIKVISYFYIVFSIGMFILLKKI